MRSRRYTANRPYGPDDDHAAAIEAARAIAYIEAHLLADLTVDVIAEACASSPYHFSPSAYRRSTDFHVRKRKHAMTPDLRESIEYVNTFHVAGLPGRFDPSNYIRLGELWKAFASKAIFAGRLGDGETCGVFRDRDAAAQSFLHLAGARIATGYDPAGLDVWELPGREYLVFKQSLVDGELHPQVAAAQAEIWGKRLAQSGRILARAPDFQIYPANFRVAQGGWIAYYLPIE